MGSRALHPLFQVEIGLHLFWWQVHASNSLCPGPFPSQFLTLFQRLIVGPSLSGNVSDFPRPRSGTDELSRGFLSSDNYAEWCIMPNGDAENAQRGWEHMQKKLDFACGVSAFDRQKLNIPLFSFTCLDGLESCQPVFFPVLPPSLTRLTIRQITNLV